MTKKRPRKEAVYAQVPSPDGSVEFHDVTTHLGRPLPFRTSRDTCGMRVTDNVVAFSLLHMTKKTASAMAAKPLDIPRGPLTRVERRAVELNDQIGDNEVLVESEHGVQKFKMIRDQNGVVELEPVNVSEPDVTFELPRFAVKLSLFMKSPSLDRLVAVGFIGHPGRPGSTETLRRVASMTLFSLTQLTPFRVVTNILSVAVPAATRSTFVPTRKAEDRARLEFPLWLFADGNPPELQASGSVMVEIDLDRANPATGKLLYQFTPSKEVEPMFDTYRQILDATVTEVLRRSFDDGEINAFAVEVVLGEINSKSVARLNEALLPLAEGLDLTPNQRQFHA